MGLEVESSAIVSRRDLFGAVITRCKEHIKQIVHPSDGEEIATGNLTTRRRFMSLLIALGATAIVPQLLSVSHVKASAPSGENPSSIKQGITSEDELPTDNKPEDHSQENSYIDTIKEATIVNGVNLVSLPLLKRIGFPIGNAYLEGKARKLLHETSLPHLIAEYGIAYPLFEEIVFRLIPSSILTTISGSKDTNWVVGVPLATVFAASHNLLPPDENTKKWRFATNRIPLSQGVVGVLFWKAMREKGFDHAFLYHTTINSEALAMAKIESSFFKRPPTDH